MFSEQNSKFDIIHAHFGPIGNIAVNLLEINAISGRLITSFHGYDINRSEITQVHGFYNKLFSFGKGFIVNSIFSSNKLQELGCIKAKIHKIPNPVDTTTFNNPSKVFYTLGQKIVLLTVGRLSSEKGHIYALRAIDELLRKDVDLLYHIVGEGPQRLEIERFIASKNMQNKVILHGGKSQGEIVDIYRSADLFLLPAVVSSTNEVDTQAIVIQEAHAMNLPVIASRVGGIPEGMIEGQTGFIIEPEDVKSLEGKLLYLINSPNKLKEMGVKARDFVQERYDNKAVIKELIRLYQDSKNYSK
jgi:colanic acid/amylovoran biosynthesis glycosyltransferase